MSAIRNQKNRLQTFLIIDKIIFGGRFENKNFKKVVCHIYQSYQQMLVIFEEKRGTQFSTLSAVLKTINE